MLFFLYIVRTCKSYHNAFITVPSHCKRGEKGEGQKTEGKKKREEKREGKSEKRQKWQGIRKEKRRENKGEIRGKERTMEGKMEETKVGMRKWNKKRKKAFLNI